jgi:hypothetical protein
VIQTVRGGSWARAVPKRRFVWDDYFEGQDEGAHFAHLRTDAASFFEDSYHGFIQELRSWALTHLGATAGLVGNASLNCFVEGCRQPIHADGNNGPWAFCFSLTKWDGRTFSGGETLVASSDRERFFEWPEHVRRDVSEYDHVAPEFGRLTVFDARAPHGVATVRGTMDPHKARVVIVGWLRAGGAHIEGALGRVDVAQALTTVAPRFAALGKRCRGVGGFITVRLTIAPSGAVAGIKPLANMLVKRRPEGSDLAGLHQAIVEIVDALRFPSANAETRLTIPIAITDH